MRSGEIEIACGAVWSFVVRRSVMRVTEMVMMSVRSENTVAVFALV